MKNTFRLSRGRPGLSRTHGSLPYENEITGKAFLVHHTHMSQESADALGVGATSDLTCHLTLRVAGPTFFKPQKSMVFPMQV